MRVLHRVFVGKGDPKTQKSKLWALSEALIPKGKGYDFNQALMDFGAVVCTARNPYCLYCPMREFCQGVSRGDEIVVPDMAEREILQVAAAVIGPPGPVFDHVSGKPAFTWRAIGSFPAASAKRMKRSRRAPAVRCSKKWALK